MHTMTDKSSPYFSYGGWIKQCINTYLERYRRCRCGLANSFVALVCDPMHPALSRRQVCGSHGRDKGGEWGRVCVLLFYPTSVREINGFVARSSLRLYTHIGVQLYTCSLQS